MSTTVANAHGLIHRDCLPEALRKRRESGALLSIRKRGDNVVRKHENEKSINNLSQCRVNEFRRWAGLFDALLDFPRSTEDVSLVAVKIFVEFSPNMGTSWAVWRIELRASANRSASIPMTG